MIEDADKSRLIAATIADSQMSRRVVCATNITRPTTQASAVVISLATELIRGMVGTGAWRGYWIGEI